MTDTTSNVAARKKKLRAEVRSRLAALDGSQLQSKSRALAERLFASPWWSGADWIFIYIPMFAEVDTRYVTARAYPEGKRVAIPRMEGGELTFYEYDGHVENLLPNQFGILEPDPSWLLVDPTRLSGSELLVLTPGLAFDRRGGRLGRGKGFYDRFLALLRGASGRGVRSRAVGLAFAEQLVDEVPVSAHDQLLDGIVTDREIIA